MLRKIILLVFILIALLVVAVVAAAFLIDPDDYREELAARASEQLGREVRLDGPIDLKFFPWLALDIRDVTVGNPPGFDQAPPLAGIERATASIRVLPLLSGQLEVGTVGIERAGIHVVTARGGASNLEGLFAAGETQAEPGQPADLSQIRTGPVQFSNVVLSVIDLAAGSRTELRLDDLELSPFSAGSDVPLSLSGQLVGDGETLLTLDLDGRVRVAADLGEVALSDWSLDYTLPSAGAEGRASGSLVVDMASNPLSVRLDPFTNELAMGELDVELTAEQALTAALGDTVDVALPAVTLSIDDQPLQLAGDASLGERIRGNLTVNGERLDLTGLAPAGDGGSGTAEPESGDAGGEADFGALGSFDLQFALDLGELVLAEGARLTEVTARSQLTGGELTLDPLSARLFGGRFDGSARVDFNQQPPEVVVTPRLSGIRVAELASMFTGRSPVDGEGEMTVDVRFSGFSAEQMLSSLNGSGDFAVAQGVLQGVDLQSLIDQELTTSNLGSIARSFGGETQFRTLSGGMQIEDGVIELPNVDLAAAGYGATGQGRIDLGAGRVDYALALDLGEELTQQLPGALRRATGGRIPLSISGDLTAPTVSVDLAGLAEGVVREELGRRLLEALQDDDDEEAGESTEDGATGEGDESAGEDAETDERDQRRDAARSLLRGLLEDDDDDEVQEPAPDAASETEDEPEQPAESDPPMA